LPILHRYLEAWPNIQAEVNFSDRIIDLVEEGYDLSVRIGAVPTDTQLITRVIAHSSTILCAAPHYLEAHPAPLTPEEIAHHRRLAFGRRRRPLPWQLHRPDETIAIIDTSPFMLFDSADAIRDAALLGSGIAYLPEFLIKEDLRNGRLVNLLLDHKTEKLPIFAIYPSRRHLSNKVRLFLDMLANSDSA
jgi:DNA-binding transcriptional LysR family regulator